MHIIIMQINVNYTIIRGPPYKGRTKEKILKMHKQTRRLR